MKIKMLTMAVVASGFLYAGANAGADLVVSSGDRVSLDGSKSTADRGGEIVEYKWRQLKKGAAKVVKLSNAREVVSSFLAPNVTKPTDLYFKLRTKEKYFNESADRYKRYKSKDVVKVTINPKESSNDIPAIIVSEVVFDLTKLTNLKKPLVIDDKISKEIKDEVKVYLQPGEHTVKFWGGPLADACYRYRHYIGNSEDLIDSGLMCNYDDIKIFTINVPKDFQKNIVVVDIEGFNSGVSIQIPAN